MKIALISLEQKWEDKAHNLERCAGLMERASRMGAELVIFPEMTLTGFTMDAAQMAEPADASPSVEAFGALARNHHAGLIAGIALRAGDKAANTLVAFSPQGGEVARYAKMHPFSLAGEDSHFQPGRTLARMRMQEFTLGFSICYDLRFPELYSALAKDCDMLVNIANWPKRRIGHWRTLLQARAIENQVYMVGVNRTGTDGNGLEYERSSAVVNANGEFLEPLASEGEMDVYEISRRGLDDFRAAFSTRQDRLPELYRTLI